MGACGSKSKSVVLEDVTAEVKPEQANPPEAAPEQKAAQTQEEPAKPAEVVISDAVSPTAADDILSPRTQLAQVAIASSVWTWLCGRAPICAYAGQTCVFK